MAYGKNVISVFLVADREMVRDGVRSLLELQPDIVVVGEAADPTDAIAQIVVAQPDVVLLDDNLPHESVIEASRELRDRCPRVRSVMLTSLSADEAHLDAFLAGASGFVLKRVRGLDLVACIRKVAHGEPLIDRATADHLRERVARGEIDPRIGPLTSQERRVLELLASGLTNREIAGELCLSDRTVKNDVSSLLMQLGMSRRSEASASDGHHGRHRKLNSLPMSDLVQIRF